MLFFITITLLIWFIKYFNNDSDDDYYDSYLITHNSCYIDRIIHNKVLFDKMTHFLLTFFFFFLKLQIGGDTGTASSRNVSSSRSRTGEEPHIGKYRLLKTIGKGNFAKVKLAKHLPTGKEVKDKTFFVLLHISFVSGNSHSKRIIPIWLSTQKENE